MPSPGLAWFLRHFKLILPFINSLIQTNPCHPSFLICCYNIPFKSRNRTGIWVSIPAGGILKQNKLLSTGKFISKIIWANRSLCKIHINCNRWLRLSTFWWLIWTSMLHRQYFVYLHTQLNVVLYQNLIHTAQHISVAVRMTVLNILFCILGR